MWGSRVTDAVEYYKQRGENRFAFRAVRDRGPDKFRWRNAVSSLTQTIGVLRGHTRIRLEEPVREMVLDVDDGILRREVVLDARRHRVDLDRGEILPVRTMGDLRRTAFLAGTNLDLVRRYVRLPDDYEAPIDTAGVVLVGRAMCEQYRKRAQQLMLEVPLVDEPARLTVRQRSILAQAESDGSESSRWAALSRTLLGDSIKG
ncbi:MAG: hypothetical protein U0230_15525 [Polyangiales bacterium]